MTVIDQERAARPPREGLRREAPFTLRAVDDVDGETNDGLTFDGFGAVFNRETIIDSWEGRFREKLLPGSMKKSFRELTPIIQFDHGRHPLLGSLPLGRMEAGYPREETDPELAPEGGARVLARLHDNWLTQPFRDAIASGSVDGMSFRFGVVKEDWTTHDGRKVTDTNELWELLARSWREDVPDEELLLRSLREVKVPEIGPVVWPAYADTSASVRSRTVTIDLARLHEPAERSKLASAALAADLAEGTEQPSTPTGAAEHSRDLDGEQPRTPTGAAEHSTTPAQPLNPAAEFVRHLPVDVRTIHVRKDA